MDMVQTCLQVIQKRLADGDLLLKGELPSERRLTEELGISRTTIRKALKILLARGVVTRDGRRRARVSDRGRRRARAPAVAFLSPAVYSSDYGLWWDGVRAAFEGTDVILRPISYMQFEDPTVHDAIIGHDALFFLPPPRKLPAWLARKMHDSGRPVVVLDQDESEAGFISVRLFPPASEAKLLDHLAALGHRRIDCLNTQPEDAVIQERVGAWREYLGKRELPGLLWSQPGDKPLSGAYDYVTRLLREGHLLATALFCTTGPCAVGALRALKEAGLEAGVDVSVCAVNDEGLGRYLYKSLTALESLPRSYYLRRAAEWMLAGGAWRGPLLVQPKEAPLYVGETTGLAPADGAQTLLARL